MMMGEQEDIVPTNKVVATVTTVEEGGGVGGAAIAVASSTSTTTTSIIMNKTTTTTTTTTNPKQPKPSQQQKNQAIPLPYDGPIHYYYNCHYLRTVAAGGGELQQQHQQDQDPSFHSSTIIPTSSTISNDSVRRNNNNVNNNNNDNDNKDYDGTILLHECVRWIASIVGFIASSSTSESVVVSSTSTSSTALCGSTTIEHDKSDDHHQQQQQQHHHDSNNSNNSYSSSNSNNEFHSFLCMLLLGYVPLTSLSQYDHLQQEQQYYSSTNHTINVQLQTLQKIRNYILLLISKNRKQQQQEQLLSNRCDDTATSSDTATGTTNTVKEFTIDTNNKDDTQQQQQQLYYYYSQCCYLLYRILLEWMISYQTPVSIRRAVASCLTAMNDYTITLYERPTPPPKVVETVPTTTSISTITTSITCRPINTSTTTTTTIIYDVLESIIQNYNNNHSHFIQQQQYLQHINDEKNNNNNHHHYYKMYWYNPLHSLQELLSWQPIEELLRYNNNNNNNNIRQQPNHNQHCFERILYFILQQTTIIMNTTNYGTNISSQQQQPKYHYNNEEEVVDHVVLIATLINKCLLIALSENDINQQRQQQQQDRILDIVIQLQQYLWTVIVHNVNNTIPIDRLSNIGIAYGRTIQYQIIYDQSYHIDSSILLEQITLSLSTTVQQITILQGIAVVIPFHTTNVIEQLLDICQQILLVESDPDVRCLAIKCIRTVISRLNTLLSIDATSTTSSNNNHEHILDVAKDVHDVQPSNDCIGDEKFNVTILRRIADDILQVTLQVWENPSTRKLANAIPPLFECIIELMIKVSIHHNANDLINRLLAQPVHVKGRYLALDVMMSHTSALQLVTQSTVLLNDLLSGIGDCSHNTAVMANLWLKILQQLRMELHQQSITEDELNEHNNTENWNCNDSIWVNYWVPSLVQALLTKDITRRKQIAAFCLPRIAAMNIKSATPRTASAPIYTLILTSMEEASIDYMKNDYSCDAIFNTSETNFDRILWFELEVIRYAALDGLLKPTLSCTRKLRDQVASLIPIDRLRTALTHSSLTIRTVAFSVIDAVIGSYDNNALTDPLQYIRMEMDTWKFALPYSIKTDSNEFVLSVLQCLILFTDRLSQMEASHQSTASREKALPLCHSFIVDFLIQDIVLKKTAYPGTVALKESFSLSLLECIIVFISRDHPMALTCKVLPKGSAAYRRRRHALEERSMSEIAKSLLSREIFDCCISLLYSIWDSTRSNSFRTLMGLVHLSQIFSIELPAMFTDLVKAKDMVNSGVFLASSPRQREADTGARLLSFLVAAFRSADDKVDLLESLVDLLDRRLDRMKRMLSTLLSNESPSDDNQLPLAYGIIHALTLTIECDAVSSSNIFSNDILDRMFCCFVQAIQISLAVVADVNDGEIIDGMDEEYVCELVGSQKTARMVNPSAIGANGIFTSVHNVSQAEHAKRLASQRIIVGSWLLTKETCGALAALLSIQGYSASSMKFDEAGRLLISTLTSLKHTGAAFVAHRALQLIAQTCFTKAGDIELRTYPGRWVEKILYEASNSEKIRDSTLRRSTGYSLGFLSLMRAERLSSSQHRLCRESLIQIIRICLPSQNQSDLFASIVQLTDNAKMSLYTIPGDSEVITLVAHDQYDSRSRIHALNVLRTILLDAPLARDVYPFVGIALIASVIGYTDAEWSVRNSSTMVFAAAMLRSIDADKNASNKDITGRHAVTLYELFRTYPTLGPFLLAVLKGGVSGLLKSHQPFSLPPILPILLLLSRVNAVMISGHESIVQVEPFIPLVVDCLKHRQVSIRENAARAIRNLVSFHKNSNSSIYFILAEFERHLLEILRSMYEPSDDSQWNHLHGILLAILNLVMAYSEIKSSLQMSATIKYIRAICRIHDGSPLVPPPCLCCAMEILWHLFPSQDDDLLVSCQEIMSWLTCDERVKANDTGSSMLAVKLSTIMANIFCSSIWSVDDAAKKETSLSQLSLLLHSNYIDIRLEATKVFKKSLSRALTNGSFPVDPSIAMKNVATLALAAVNYEAGVQENPHPPTLRRLTRCLIHCIAALRLYNSVTTFQDINSDSTFTSWNILHGTRIVKCASELLTILAGNAMELAIIENAILDEEDKTRLSNLIYKCSDALAHWRVRLSATKTLQWLVGKCAESDDKYECFEDINVVRSLLNFIQDEDVEVRNGVAKMNSRTDSYNVAELSFEQNMRKIIASYPSKTLQSNFLNIVLLMSEKALEKVDIYMNDLSHSTNNDIKQFPTIWNVSTNRDIFEKDEPNSYHEQCFLCQLLSVWIVRMCSQPHVELTILQDFLQNARQMLSKLLEYISGRNPHYNITQSSGIFPLVHNLLIGSIVLSYIVDKDNCGEINEMQQLAFKIVIELDKKHNDLVFHPLIAQALRTLSIAKTSKLNAVSAIQECCFLVPIQE